MSRFRDWGNDDYGTCKPQPMKKRKEESLGFYHGMRGGVKFHEPVRFQFRADGAKLTNGASPVAGSPQPLKQEK